MRNIGDICSLNGQEFRIIGYWTGNTSGLNKPSEIEHYYVVILKDGGYIHNPNESWYIRTTLVHVSNVPGRGEDNG